MGMIKFLKTLFTPYPNYSIRSGVKNKNGTSVFLDTLQNKSTVVTLSLWERSLYQALPPTNYDPVTEEFTNIGSDNLTYRAYLSFKKYKILCCSLLGIHTAYDSAEALNKQLSAGHIIKNFFGLPNSIERKKVKVVASILFKLLTLPLLPLTFLINLAKIFTEVIPNYCSDKIGFFNQSLIKIAAGGWGRKIALALPILLTSVLYFSAKLTYLLGRAITSPGVSARSAYRFAVETLGGRAGKAVGLVLGTTSVVVSFITALLLPAKGVAFLAGNSSQIATGMTQTLNWIGQLPVVSSIHNGFVQAVNWITKTIPATNLDLRFLSNSTSSIASTVVTTYNAVRGFFNATGSKLKNKFHRSKEKKDNNVAVINKNKNGSQNVGQKILGPRNSNSNSIKVCKKRGKDQNNNKTSFSPLNNLSLLNQFNQLNQRSLSSDEDSNNEPYLKKSNLDDNQSTCNQH